MKAAHTSSGRRPTYWIIRAALGAGILIVALFCVRVVAGFHARRELASRLADSGREQRAIHARLVTRVLPVFDEHTQANGDCVAAQRAVMRRAPRPVGEVFQQSAAWFPLNGAQIEFVHAHRKETAAMGEAVTRCDRLLPESAASPPDSSAWGDVLDVYRRAEMLLLDGRVHAFDGDIETASLRFLQSQRLGFELGLDGNLLGVEAGASVIGGAEDALARLAVGAPGAMRDRVSRELAALEPFLPDLPDAFRLHDAEAAALLAESLLQVPLWVEAVLPASKLDVAPWSFNQRMAVLALPPSAHGAALLIQTKSDTDAALRVFSELNLRALSQLDSLERHGTWSIYSSNVVLHAKRAGRERLRAAAHSALLRAVIDLAQVRDSQGRYPAAPKLPIDPFAPNQPLACELISDQHYRLSSVGDGEGSSDRWVIVSSR